MLHRQTVCKFDVLEPLEMILIMMQRSKEKERKKEK